MIKLVMLFKRVDSMLYYTFKYPFYKGLFKRIGARTRILKPLKIEGYEHITLGRNVIIGKYTWLAAYPFAGGSVTLEINDEAVIGNFNHIYASEKIVIGKNVLTADKVYISDNRHTYERVDIPVMHQPIKQLEPVTIGEGTWIGENVCIFGASIGKNCVIGANAVVNKNIPDYSLAMGSPARVVKRFCFTDGIWKKVDQNGDFISN
jgi:acetyltransferase-like isoleucine patch superfamily enzyme